MKDADIVDDLRWMLPAREFSLNPWYFAGGVLLLVILALIAFWLWRRRKKTGSIFTPPTPHERALKALRALFGCIEEAQDLSYIVSVSQIVREYIQERFGLRAPHRSTEEFLNEARSSQLLDPAHQELLKAFLLQCDLVKFALHRTDLEQRKQLHQAAQRFVEGTIPEVPQVGTPH